MNIKHIELEATPNNAFQKCKLGRERYGKILTEIVTNYADGFVLAINNEWGTGKTTFVRMWEQHLKEHYFHTLYFNAWENDFDSNPLVALLGELKKLFPVDTNNSFKNLLNKGAVLTKNILPTLVKQAVKKYTGKEDIANLLEATSEGATEIFEKEVEEYSKKKEGIVEFKEQLKKFINENATAKPIIFIIDELDRCRPSYSVEVLENIKHFFDVSGIVFVLSIDKQQFGNAIRGFYGSELIKAEEYLRRFIDVEYSLPRPEYADIVKYFFEYYNFDSFFLNQNRQNRQRYFRGEREAFIKLCTYFFEEKNLTMRQIDKLFAHARLSILSVKHEEYLFPLAFIILIFIYHFDEKLFESIRNRELTTQIFNDTIEELFSFEVSHENKNLFILSQALLIYLYSNYYKQKHLNEVLIISNPPPNDRNISIHSKSLSITEYNTFTQQIIKLKQEYFEDINIKLILDKIQLFDNLNL